MLGGSPSLVGSPDVPVEYEYREKLRCSWTVQPDPVSADTSHPTQETLASQ